MSWHKNKFLSYTNIAEFIDSGCNVLATIESIDFKLLANGNDLKREVTESALAVICKGLNSILMIDGETEGITEGINDGE